MRTDGVTLSAEAVEGLRGVIATHYGQAYLPPPGSRVYKSRAKNAQEAHEAIRPTNPALLPGQGLGLTADQVEGGWGARAGGSAAGVAAGGGDTMAKVRIHCTLRKR